MTEMAAKRIYGKTPSEIFSQTSGQISMKLGMKHRGIKSIILYSVLTQMTGTSVVYSLLEGEMS